MSDRVTEAVVRAVAAQALSDEPPPRLIAIASEPAWSGPEALDVDGHSVQVRACASVLAVREEVVRARTEQSNGALRILLTDRSDRELGEEILAALWRYRVHHPSGWERLKHAFRVDALDPALADARWLVDLLAQVAPARGFPPPNSGYLSKELAWRSFREHGLSLRGEAPRLADVMAWATTDEAANAVSLNVGTHAREVAAALEADLGAPARWLLRLVKGGMGRQAVALGLVADTLWGPDQPETMAVAKARGRFEALAKLKSPATADVRAWGAAAIDALLEAEQRGHDVTFRQWIEQAEETLHRIDAVDLAAGSRVLPRSFDARLAALGLGLLVCIEADSADDESVGEAERLLGQVKAHRLSDRREARHRTERAEMALRMIRWLLDPPKADDEDLYSLASQYRSHGAWLDRARESVHEGDSVAGVVEAYAEILERVDEARVQRDSAFATALSNWSSTSPDGDGPVLPVERVLDQVVAPVAEYAPVLLVVLDGLSHAEALKLDDDLRHRGWRPQGPNGDPVRPVIAMLPTVTEVSRTSLLTGSRTRGGQAEEVKGFQAHSALAEVSGTALPQLFHKKDLKVEKGQIAPTVRDAVLDPKQQVVGVVVNAVDDHLAKGSQLRLAEGLEALRPLRPLLDVGSEANRAVIIVSDHGHVLETGTSVRLHEGGGERWRPAHGEVQDDEVLVKGPRVMLGDGAAILAATDGTRYLTSEKRGYHGGATPQEVLCPLLVLVPGSLHVPGWEELPREQPRWWGGEPAPEIGASAPAPTPTPWVESTGQSSFLAEDGEVLVSTPSGPEWLSTLMASPMWSQQRELAAGAAPDDATAHAVLSLLDRSHGRASPKALSDALDMPVTRTRTVVEALKRLVNVDGYPVLKLEGDGTAVLERQLLLEQFEVTS